MTICAPEARETRLAGTSAAGWARPAEKSAAPSNGTATATVAVKSRAFLRRPLRACLAARRWRAAGKFGRTRVHHAAAPGRLFEPFAIARNGVGVAGAMGHGANKRLQDVVRQFRQAVIHPQSLTPPI